MKQQSSAIRYRVFFAAMLLIVFAQIVQAGYLPSSSSSNSYPIDSVDLNPVTPVDFDVLVLEILSNPDELVQDPFAKMLYEHLELKKRLEEEEGFKRRLDTIFEGSQEEKISETDSKNLAERNKGFLLTKEEVDDLLVKASETQEETESKLDQTHEEQAEINEEESESEKVDEEDLKKEVETDTIKVENLVEELIDPLVEGASGGLTSEQVEIKQELNQVVVDPTTADTEETAPEKREGRFAIQEQENTKSSDRLVQNNGSPPQPILTSQLSVGVEKKQEEGTRQPIQHLNQKKSYKSPVIWKEMPLFVISQDTTGKSQRIEQQFFLHEQSSQGYSEQTSFSSKSNYARSGSSAAFEYSPDWGNESNHNSYDEKPENNLKTTSNLQPLPDSLEVFSSHWMFRVPINIFRFLLDYPIISLLVFLGFIFLLSLRR
jgi:hypothetical protein